MHSVQISIPKRFLSIPYFKKVLTKVPADWNELTCRQLIKVCKSIDRACDIHELKSRLVPILLKVSPSLYWFFSSEQIATQLWPLTEFILESNTLTKNLQPTIRIGLHRWHGPRDDLANMSLLEFAYADTYFIQYHRTKDAQWLDKLIGCIYRPRDPEQDPQDWKFSGDNRVPFNPYLIELNTRTLAKLNKYRKEAILLWFHGCRLSMENRYPYVFSARGDGLNGDATPWPEFITAMGGGKFGTVNQVGAERIHTVLLDANTHLENAQKRK